MKRLLLLLLLASAPAFAQNITAASTTCNGTGACVQQSVSTTNGGASISLSGTFSATLQFEATNAVNPYDPANAGLWTSIQMTPTSSSTAATSATAPGIWQANVAGLTAIRVRCSTYTSGTVSVVINLSAASARANGGGGTGGAVSSVSNSDTTLVISPTTGAVVASVNQAFPFNFTAAGAASVPGFTVSGAPFQGTGTTSTPQVYLNCNGSTQPSTWLTTGTFFGINTCSSFGGNFFDFRVNGSASANSLSASGNLVLQGSITLNGSNHLTTPAILNGANSRVSISYTAPTISSGFGTSPSIVSSGGSPSFTVNVGTGGTATGGVIGMPTATTGWVCSVNDITARNSGTATTQTFQTASSTTSVTVTNQLLSTGVATAWTASDVLNLSCFAN